VSGAPTNEEDRGMTGAKSEMGETSHEGLYASQSEAQAADPRSRMATLSEAWNEDKAAPHNGLYKWHYCQPVLGLQSFPFNSMI